MVALEQPTAVVLSGSPGGDWAHWQKWIAGPFFRVYTNDDMAGVEIASGFKNIIALAVGMADGLGAGDNTRGTLMTRGMIELSRLGIALGGKKETFLSAWRLNALRIRADFLLQLKAMMKSTWRTFRTFVLKATFPFEHLKLKMPVRWSPPFPIKLLPCIR